MPVHAASAPASPDTAVLIDIDPGLVEANPEQPRRDFDHQALVALGDSIRTHGLLHPIVVERDGPRYRLVAGERRLRAVRLAGMPRVAAIVRPAAESARQSLETALTENLLRADLSPMEEASAYSRLADTFGLSHEAIALRLGRSRPAISNTIRLLALAAPVQRAVAAGTISAGHARALLGLADPAQQEEMAASVATEGWSVRQTEAAVQLALGRAASPRAAPARPALSPDDEALRRGLEEQLGLPVELERRRRGGRVIVVFHDDGDLDALYRRLRAAEL
ncbi:MAG TPA: ParB/RepB/Spo0J family partition protein [Candidatus Dormibacteraeota bacterium]|jgi:ParB family chromosome partitioning protein|nr:ParB/RepB/Spo0J family partition protein [Candidatus Dormibacteraeota bacterium]